MLPSSVNEAAPVQAKIPARSHMINAGPAEPTPVKIADGDEKMPDPI
jgi:hypothetical protein